MPRLHMTAISSLLSRAALDPTAPQDIASLDADTQDKVRSLGGPARVALLHPVFAALEHLAETSDLSLHALHPPGGLPLYIRLSHRVGTVAMVVVSCTTVGFLPTWSKESLARIIANHDAAVLKSFTDELPHMVAQVHAGLMGMGGGHLI